MNNNQEHKHACSKYFELFTNFLIYIVTFLEFYRNYTWNYTHYTPVLTYFNLF